MSGPASSPVSAGTSAGVSAGASTASLVPASICGESLAPASTASPAPLSTAPLPLVPPTPVPLAPPPPSPRPPAPAPPRPAAPPAPLRPAPPSPLPPGLPHADSNETTTITTQRCTHSIISFPASTENAILTRPPPFLWSFSPVAAHFTRGRTSAPVFDVTTAGQIQAFRARHPRRAGGRPRRLSASGAVPPLPGPHPGRPVADGRRPGRRPSRAPRR